MDAHTRPPCTGPRPAICGFIGDGEAFVERCPEVPHAEAALARLRPLLSADRRQWVVVGTRWLHYDIEESWYLADPHDAGAIEFWRLTWRQGPNY